MRGFLVLAATLAIIFGGCDSTPHWPAPASGGWSTFTHPTLGYSVDYPTGCKVQQDERGVLIRFEGGPIIAINWVTDNEGRHRGLWAGHDPAGEIELGGHKGTLYRYQHGDGPLVMNVISYVVPYRGRSLGLELRTAGDTLTPAQQHVVDSFALPE